MRFVALGLIPLFLPLFIVWLKNGKNNRDKAMLLLGVLVFASGSLQVDAAIITWSLWAGTSRGILVSVGDMLALALLLTRKHSGRPPPFTVIMVGYLAVLGLSVIYSRIPMASLFSVWDFMRVILAFVVVAGEVSRPTAYPALLRGLSIGLIVQAGFVVEQKLTGVVQASGTMGHQNLLGMLTELAFLSILGAMLEGQRHWLLKLGLLAGAIVVAAGGSRAALGLTGIAAALLIVLSIIRGQSPGKFAIAGAAVATLLVAAPVAMITLKDRFGDMSILTEEDQRAAMERAARAMHKDNPLGVGANLYTNTANIEGYSDRAGVTWYGNIRSVPVHNAYLLARAETGYQGEVMLILLLTIPAIAGMAHAFRRRRSPMDGWTLGPAVALAAIAAHSKLEFDALVFAVTLPVGMSIGIIAGRIRAAQFERRTQSAGPPEAPALDDKRAAPDVARLPRLPVARTIARPRSGPADGGLPRT